MKFAENKNVRMAALLLGGVIALLVTFCLGVFAGASALGRYPHPHLNILRILGPYFGLTGHGAIGIVTKIDTSTLTMMDRLNDQQTINVSATTIMEDDRRHRIQFQDIHVGDRIAVIGSPENGAINARFIRLIGREPSDLPFQSPSPKDPRIEDGRKE